MKIRKYIFFLIFYLPIPLFSQIISGYVTDIASGETLPGAVIYDSISQNSTNTNKYGFYSLSSKTKEVSLNISFYGYETFTSAIRLTKDTAISFFLKPSIFSLSEVTVTTDSRIQQDKAIGLLDLPIQRLKNVPMLFGEPDIIKALSLTPGVSIGLEGTSGLLVRGGTQDQNLILLDEATVYNVSHLFGLVSSINPDAIKKVDLYKAGFPARYGGRLSSVLDITMKEGNNQSKKGEWSIGLLSSRFLIEGPLTKKLKDKTSYMFSARTFYLGIFTLPSYIAFKLRKESRFVTYWMYDFNFKLKHKFNDNSQIFFSLYQGRDMYKAGEGDSKMRSTFGLNWGNTTTTLRYVRPLSNKFFLTSVLLYSRYKYGIDIDVFTVRNNKNERENFFHSKPGIQDWAFKAGLDYFASIRQKMKFGFESTIHKYQPAFIETSYEINKEKLNEINTPLVAKEGAVFVEDEVAITPWFKSNIGLRGLVFNVENKNYFSMEPRVTGNILLPNNFSLKGGYSIMRQYTHLLVNNGIGFPNDIWVPATRNVPPQFSKQISFGISKKVKDANLEISIEAYHKTTSHIIDYKDGANYLTNFNETWEQSVHTNGKGKAYGLETFINKTKGRFTGWISYTLSWSKRKFEEINSGNWYAAPFERRHNVAVTGLYSITPKINVSGNWIFQTGAPVTVPVAIRQNFINIPAVYIYKDRNNFRLPFYHRLDITFSFLHTTAKNKQTIWAFGFYNIYNRANPFYIDLNRKGIIKDGDFNSGYQPGYVSGETNNLRLGSFLPILPYVSYTKKF